MSNTKIQWTDSTWNPITGCTKISAGCKNCYAQRMARRLAGRFGYPAAPNHFNVTLHPDRMAAPLIWKKPRHIFVNSMSDLFHEDVPDSFIFHSIDIMRRAHWHTFQVLTKRPLRMREMGINWPKNVWIGVSVENQKTAEERIPYLLTLPAHVRFLSVEPLLGPINLELDYAGKHPDYDWGIHWVIAGGESGPGARPMHPDWVRSIRDQCQDADVPFFFKQWGAYVPMKQLSGGDYGTNGHKPWDDNVWVWKVGKKAAGRLLDGETWDQMPYAAGM